MIEQIQTIEDIQALAMSGFTDWKRVGCVATKCLDNLILFNYTAEAQYKGEWNFFERVSRGLIIDTETGDIVARPFDKFFNWGEGGRFSNAPIKYVAEKLDGSMGVLFRHKGEYRIATRGSFDSAQAQWATRYWKGHYAHVDIPDDLTLMFEIIYPENRVVVDYKGKEGLYLIGARNRVTGKYFSDLGLSILMHEIGAIFPTPDTYYGWNFNDIQAHLAITTNAEGFVVRFTDGQFFKFKADEYLRLHKLIFSLSFKGVLNAMRTGTLDEYIGAIPDEFLGDVKRWVAHIEETIGVLIIDINFAYNEAPKDSRKEFALWVQNNHPKLKPYLFAMLDDKPITPIIFNKYEFTEPK